MVGHRELPWAAAVGICATEGQQSKAHHTPFPSTVETSRPIILGCSQQSRTLLHNGQSSYSPPLKLIWSLAVCWVPCKSFLSRTTVQWFSAAFFFFFSVYYFDIKVKEKEGFLLLHQVVLIWSSLTDLAIKPQFTAITTVILSAVILSEINFSS